MRGLLDVNVLIALLDADHVHHGLARTWLRAHEDDGWASCPITENGCVRIMSLSAYPGRLPVSAVVGRLRAATQTVHHTFWPDDVSLLDAKVVDHFGMLGGRQVTDTYLLALAVANRGRLVTFDQRISVATVVGAFDENLVLL